MTKKEVALEDDIDAEPSKDTELAKPENDKAELTEEETVGLESEAKVPEAPEAPVVEEAPEGGEIEFVGEKFYDLNLSRIWRARRKKETPRALRSVRQYAAKRMKTDNAWL